MKKKKSNAGRKKLPEGSKRKQVSVYIRESDILRHGGEEPLKGKIIKLAEGEI